jgi:chemotaxis protein histidine kinase CheA
MSAAVSQGLDDAPLKVALASLVEVIGIGLASIDDHEQSVAALVAMVDGLGDAMAAADSASRGGLSAALAVWHEASEVRALAPLPLDADEWLPLLDWFVGLDAHLTGGGGDGEGLALALSAEGWWSPPSREAMKAIAVGLDREGPWRPGEAPAHVASPSAPEPFAAVELRWISPDERELVAQALDAQWLPAALALISGDPETADTAQEEFAFQTSLLGNAMDHLGLATLAELTALLPVAAADENAVPAIVDLGVALQAWWSEPHGDTAAALAETALPVWVAIAGDASMWEDWSSRWHDECGGLRFGVDPDRPVSPAHELSEADVDLAVAADVSAAVLDAMRRELPGRSLRLGRALRRFASGADAAALADAIREAHTLKGDANTVGIRGLANLNHALEDLLLKMPGSDAAVFAPLLERAGDAIEASAEAVLQSGPAPEGLLALYGDLIDAVNGGLPVAADATAALPPSPAPASTPAQDIASEPVAVATLAVPVPLLDRLQDMAGDALVVARGVELCAQSLSREHVGLQVGLRRQTDLVSRLDDLVAVRGAALKAAQTSDPASIDPLEMDQYTDLYVVSRQLIEVDSDRREQANRVDALLRQLDDLRVQNERLQREIQRSALQARMLPFRGLVPRLERIVRQTGRALGKDVALHVTGDEVLVEADLLDALAEPLAHLIRNAIDHGIEATASRLAQGKPEQGALRLALSTNGDLLRIDFADDGAGFDEARILAKARKLSLIPADAPLDRDAVLRLVLLPGFSIREDATQVSGRGIGMDIVLQRVQQLGGRLVLGSDPGRGSRVGLRLPVNQGRANALVLGAGEHRLALVSSAVERIVPPGDWVEGDRPDEAILGEERIPLLSLRALFTGGDFDAGSDAEAQGLLLRRDDGRLHLLRVPPIFEAQAVTLRPLPASLRGWPGVRGITLLGDGRVAPVVDPGALLDLAEERGIDARGRRIDVLTLPTVVVADDSSGVRRSISEAIEDAGFVVVQAADGIEAIDAIQKHRPVAVVVDLEMPRMNGLDVTRYIRNEPALRHMPVLMVTSRAGGRHDDLATAAGVDRVFGKPFDAEALVDALGALMRGRTPDGSVVETP